MKSNDNELLENNTTIENSSHFNPKKTHQRYSHFALEFKKFQVTQLFNYGQNFSVNIDITGNILYRAFFEIELPVLSFTDSIITNSTWITFKQNKLNNLTEEIDKWNDLYSNLKSFSNIIFEVYVEAKKIIKLQNITLDFLKNRVLNITNTHDENIKTYRLLIDTNILSSLDIAAYIISVDEIDGIETVIDDMYNTNLNYLNYYHSNYIYYTKQYDTVNTGSILAKWIEHIGHYYFNFFELLVNGYTVDNYSNDFLHLYQQHKNLSQFTNNYNSLIGNTTAIYNNKGSTNYIYTPLIFSFNADPSLALPLVGMQNCNIKINSRINDVKNIVYLQDWISLYNDIKVIKLRRDQHTTDDMNGIQIYDLPYDKIDLKVPEYIYTYYCSYVDKRVLDAKFPGIDSNIILNTFGSLDDDNNKVLTQDDFIYLMNNIKTDTSIPESSKVIIAGYHYFIDYNYILNLIPKPKINLLLEYGFINDMKNMALQELTYIIETHHEVELTINKTSFYDSLNDVDGLIKEIYVFPRKKLNISNYGKNNYTDFEPNNIQSIEFKIQNEFNLFEHYIINYDHFAKYNLNHPPPDGVWFRTFSLNPYSIQPIGFGNFNNITGQNIVILIDENNNDNYYNSKNNPYKIGTEFKILYTKYNIMNVHKGNIELTFYN